MSSKEAIDLAMSSLTTEFLSEEWTNNVNAKIEDYVTLEKIAKELEKSGWSPAWGMLIGTNSNLTSSDTRIKDDIMSLKIGYTTGNEVSGANLYYPHKNSLNSCCSYWMASPSAHQDNFIMRVYYNGYLGSFDYNTTETGLRPIVAIPRTEFNNVVSDDYKIN